MKSLPEELMSVEDEWTLLKNTRLETTKKTCGTIKKSKRGK
jgi:hypothetical protein